MKKVIASLIACALVLSASAMLASQPDARFLGDWYVHTSDFDGNWMSIQITAHGITIPMGELGERVDPQIKNGELVALNGMPVDPSVTTEFLSATLFINNPVVDVVSVMNLLTDGSAVLMHLQVPDAYFTLIPAP